MLWKFLVFLTLPAWATNSTESSSSSAAAADDSSSSSAAAAAAAASSSSAAATATASGNTTTAAAASSSAAATAAGNTTTAAAASSSAAAAATGNTTTTTTATTTAAAATTKAASGGDGDKKDGDKMDGTTKPGMGTKSPGMNMGMGGGNATNGTGATGGTEKVLKIPLKYKTEVDGAAIATSGKATCFTNIALLATGMVAVSVGQEACGMITPCSATNTDKCCFTRDAPTATPASLTQCNTFSSKTMLLELTSGCSLDRRLAARRNLANATTAVEISDAPGLQYNDADSAIDTAMEAAVKTVNAATDTEFTKMLADATKQVAAQMAAGLPLMGLTIGEMTGDSSATKDTYADVFKAADASATNLVATKENVAVATAGGSTSGAVTTALSGAVLFVFAFLF